LKDYLKNELANSWAAYDAAGISW